MSSRQHPHAPQNRVRLLDGHESQEKPQRLCVHLWRYHATSQKRFDLRCENQTASGFGIEQWLDAEMVAGEEEPLVTRSATPIVNSQREHSAQALDEGITELEVKAK